MHREKKIKTKLHQILAKLAKHWCWFLADMNFHGRVKRYLKKPITPSSYTKHRKVYEVMFNFNIYSYALLKKLLFSLGNVKGAQV